MHAGAPKTWYVVPGSAAAALEKAADDVFANHPDRYHPLMHGAHMLMRKTVIMSPSVLLARGVPVFRATQRPREIIVTFPRGYHSGFNHGFHTGEAINFAMPDWFLKNEASGGPIAEQASHLLDVTRFILGNPKAIKVSSFGLKNMALDKKEFTAENSIQLIYQLENGVIGVHTNHCGQERSCFDLELIGPRIRITANATDKTIHGVINGKKFSENTPDETQHGLNKVTAWLKAISTGNNEYLQSDYLDSLSTQSLIDAAIKSRKNERIESVEPVK